MAVPAHGIGLTICVMLLSFETCPEIPIENAEMKVPLSSAENQRSYLYFVSLTAVHRQETVTGENTLSFDRQ